MGLFPSLVPSFSQDKIYLLSDSHDLENGPFKKRYNWIDRRQGVLCMTPPYSKQIECSGFGVWPFFGNEWQSWHDTGPRQVKTTLGPSVRKSLDRAGHCLSRVVLYKKSYKLFFIAEMIEWRVQSRLKLLNTEFSCQIKAKLCVQERECSNASKECVCNYA